MLLIVGVLWTVLWKKRICSTNPVVNWSTGANGGAASKADVKRRSPPSLDPHVPCHVGAGKRSVLLRSALRMPARGPRRGLCAMSIIMHHA
jgi:hypothetical protein